MRFTLNRAVTIAAMLAAIAVAGCGKKAAEQTPAPTPAETTPPAPVALSVTGFDLGSQIDADKKIPAPKTTFGTKDTIYVSIATAGSATSATLAAKWTYGTAGQLVNEMSQPIAPTGPAYTEFHIAKPKPWPTGTYHVTISLDGTPAGTKDFEIK